MVTTERRPIQYLKTISLSTQDLEPSDQTRAYDRQKQFNNVGLDNCVNHIRAFGITSRTEAGCDSSSNSSVLTIPPFVGHPDDCEEVL